MTQEQKDLLLKDICGRLPYDVKCKIEMRIGCDVWTIYNINSIGYVEIVEDSDTNGVSIEMVKPYLFPLDSMSEEQRKEFVATLKYLPADEIDIWTLDTYDWCNKNHFDYRGLIPMGLANNAVGLNIY